MHVCLIDGSWDVEWSTEILYFKRFFIIITHLKSDHTIINHCPFKKFKNSISYSISMWILSQSFLQKYKSQKVSDRQVSHIQNVIILFWSGIRKINWRNHQPLNFMFLLFFSFYHYNMVPKFSFNRWICVDRITQWWNWKRKGSFLERTNHRSSNHPSKISLLYIQLIV